MIEKHGGKNVSSVSSKTDYLLAGDNMGPAKREKAERLGITIIGLEEFKSQHAENSVYVIDVRYPREYESGHIPGAALIPLELLNSKLSELSRLTKPIITYCH